MTTIEDYISLETVSNWYSDAVKYIAEGTRALLAGIPSSDSAVTSVLVTLLCILVTLIVVVAFVALGWYIVWTCFLSRFKFVRELLLGTSPPTPPTESPQETPKKRPPRKKHYD